MLFTRKLTRMDPKLIRIGIIPQEFYTTHAHAQIISFLWAGKKLLLLSRPLVNSKSYTNTKQKKIRPKAKEAHEPNKQQETQNKQCKAEAQSEPISDSILFLRELKIGKKKTHRRIEETERGCWNCRGDALIRIGVVAQEFLQETCPCADHFFPWGRAFLLLRSLYTSISNHTGT